MLVPRSEVMMNEPESSSTSAAGLNSSPPSESSGKASPTTEELRAASTESSSEATGVFQKPTLNSLNDEQVGEDMDYALHRASERAQVNGFAAFNVYVNYNYHRSGGVDISGGSVSGSGIAGRDASNDNGPLNLATPPARWVRVDQEELDKLGKVTVQVLGFATASQRLEGRRLLVLRGSPGCGKRAAAVGLLRRFGKVYDIERFTTFEALTHSLLETRQDSEGGYVLTLDDGASMGTSNGHSLAAFSRRLEAVGMRLIVIMTDSVEIPPELREFTFEWRERSDTLSALRAHLRFYIAQSPGNSRNLPEEASLFESLLTEDIAASLRGRPMREIDGFAQLVVRLLAEGRSLDEAISEFGLDPDNRVRAWFDRQAELDVGRLSFLLAATVLGGCSYVDIADRTGSIAAILAELTRTRLDDCPSPALRLRDVRLGDVMAIRNSVNEVSLDPITLVPAVLAFVWKHCDALAEGLMRWLYKAARDPNVDIRLRVAMAAGQLAAFDLRVVKARILEPWALSSNHNCRLAAADALGVLAGQDRAAPHVQSLIKDWVSSPTSQFVWTAAAACGGYVGLQDPATALEALRRVAMHPLSGMRRIAVINVCKLYRLSAQIDESKTVIIADCMASWMSDDRRPVREAGQAAFAELMKEAANRESGLWPSLWNSIAADDAIQSAGQLLTATMGRRMYRSQVKKAISSLVRICDEGEVDQYDPLRRLVHASVEADAAMNRGGDYVRFFLDRWSRAPRCSDTARRLLEELRKKEVA
jgi:hypothetical protein